ncbi:MAG TPA: DNA polymerase I [Thermoflexales bacterium]|nr:DNA polymerase I [Thermoflexales bacterium]
MSTSKTRPKLILIDGHSLAYRAYFAMVNTPLSIENASGEKEMTGAVFAFANMLLKVWNQEQPTHLAVAFDVGRTFRDDLYAEYKGTREKMPEELVVQLKRIQQVVDALSVPIYTAEGYEADDVLGTLARRASGEGMDVVIVTGDRDALQLVSPNVKVLTSRQRFDDTIVYDEAGVLEKYGVTPAQLIDYKALVGDTSDNVPGVSGIGEKTAQALIQQFGTLDAMYLNLDAITAKRPRTALTEQRANAYLSKQLVTIKTDVPLEVDWDACRTSPDYTRTLNLFRELRFESLMKRIPQATPAEAVTAAQPEGQLGLFAVAEVRPKLAEDPPAANVPIEPRIVASDADYKALLAELNGATLIAFDTETMGTDPLTDEVVGMSFCVRQGEAWYLPCGPAGGSPWQLDPASPRFQPIADALRRNGVRLVGHNAKFDLEVLQEVGITIEQAPLDTMVAQFLIDPGAGGLGLKNMAFTLLGWQMTEIAELIGKGKNQITMRDVPVERAGRYAAADAAATWELWHVLEPKLAERGVAKLFHEVETPLIPVLMAMETHGVAVDTRYLGELSAELGTRLRELESEIYNQAGMTFNINSTQQLSDLLFNRLKLPPDKAWKTASGNYSTNADVLEQLRDKHAIVASLLDYRELSKLKGTYVDALPELINKKTGRIHTDFNQTGAITGRISSSKPNLQNIPIKTEIGRRVRKAFIPRRGWRLISADYSQVELRILAHLANDATLREAFLRGEDIHATTAAAVNDVPLDSVTPMQRNFAKRINFGIAYGMGAFALSQNTGMSMSEAGDFIKRYFDRFPAVQNWLSHTKLVAAEQGYVETVLGRRRYFPELRNQMKGGQAEAQKRRAEREAINHPVQGSAADIMKIAMIRIDHALSAGNYQARMTLQVHDELVFDVPPNEVDEIKALVEREMEGAYSLTVPLRVDVGSGPNWDEVK